MQSVQKQTKKSGFKCPTFSVPAKTKAENSSIQDVSGKGLEQEKLKPKIPEKTTPDIENNKHHVEQSRLEDAQQQSCKQQAGGDNKSNNVVDISTNEGKNILMAGDCLRTSSKKVKSKKKSDFKVKAAVEESEGDEKKQAIKDKKKKMEDGSGKMEKLKQIKEKKEKKSDLEKKEIPEKKPPLPVRSLTDEEYIAIFEAAIQNAVNLNIEEWEPKVSPPVKVKEPVKKKFSVTVGRKKSKTLNTDTPMESKADHLQQSNETDLHEDFPEKGKESEDIPDMADVGDVEHNQGDEKEELGANEQVDGNNNAVEEIEVDGDNADEEIEANVILDWPVLDSAQNENETTPAGSEVDITEKKTNCISTPVKKKKLQKINKKPKLEPKQLPFERKSASMIDKIKELREVKKEKQNVASKKRKLDNGPNKAVKEQKKGNILPKEKNRQKSSPKKNKRQKMQERELELNGTWVQCCNSTCLKWRYLPDINDPILVPERWTCSMNSNQDYSSCDKPEESYDESEHIYTKYAEGSVIWARMAGYPWWPAMVEMDPDTETFFSIETNDSMFPTHYHVVFFDEHVSRAWIKTDCIKTFTGDEGKDGIIYQNPKKGVSYSRDVAAAKKNALKAFSCTIKERIELFGFAARYKGPWTSKYKGKSKSVKVGKTRKAAQVEDCLDDRTMSDVLDNTDALLENVEEMLDSIDSQLFDSDADSDFVPKELVVVETKRKKTGVSRACKEKQKNITKENFADDSEIDIVAVENEDVTDADRIRKIVAEKEEETGLEQIKEPKTKAVFKILNLDSDIFTMEMGSQEESSSVARTDKKVKHEPIKKEVKKITEKRGREFQVPCEDKTKESNKMKENKTGDHLKDEIEKNDRSDTKEMEETVKTAGESQKSKSPSGQIVVTSKKDSSESSCKKVENVANSVAELVVHMETESNSKSGKCNDVHIGKRTDGGVLYSDLRTMSAENTETEAGVLGTLEIENEMTREEDTGELVDLGNIEVDAHSGNIDESNSFVPDIDLEDSHIEPQRNHEQSLEDESDGEFDLGENYMYEINTDGSDKVRDRTLGAQRIMEVDEDSDPFELMEE